MISIALDLETIQKTQGKKVGIKDQSTVREKFAPELLTDWKIP